MKVQDKIESASYALRVIKKRNPLIVIAPPQIFPVIPFGDNSLMSFGKLVLAPFVLGILEKLSEVAFEQEKALGNMEWAGAMSVIHDCATQCRQAISAVSVASVFADNIPYVGFVLQKAVINKIPVAGLGCVPICLLVKAMLTDAKEEVLFGS